MKRHTKKAIEKAEKLRDQGKSVAVISRLTGIPAPTLYQKFRRTTKDETKPASQKTQRKPVMFDRLSRVTEALVSSGRFSREELGEIVSDMWSKTNRDTRQTLDAL